MSSQGIDASASSMPPPREDPSDDSRTHSDSFEDCALLGGGVPVTVVDRKRVQFTLPCGCVASAASDMQRCDCATQVRLKH